MSYERSVEDVRVLTGIEVSRGTQHRLVHRQCFDSPQMNKPVEEISIDGGKVRLRTPKGQPCRWQDYKAVNLHQQSQGAFFQHNDELTTWVNQQPLSPRLICLGDGHDGVWNLVDKIGETSQRCEILDWYHLIENLYKIEVSQWSITELEALLWQGHVDETLDRLRSITHPHVENFINYLNKHRHRIINYEYYQLEGISIGSGAVESTVKQIAARIKIAGAQWKSDNVPQVLRQRCAYLNGEFSTA